MKIAFDYQIFLSQKYGGISRYFVNLANNLILDNDVEIVAPFHKNIYLKNINHNRNIFLKNTFPKTEKILSSLNQIFTISRLNNFKPEILHQTYYSNLNYNSRFKPKIVTTVHDMIHEKFPIYFPNNNKIIANKKKSIQKADHIICVSECTKNDLMDLYSVPSHKISVVYHGFELENTLIENDEIPLITKPYLLYVGNRSGYKNFNFFIKSISKSSNIIKDFNIIAFGGQNFNKFELELFKSCGFRDNQILHFDGDDSLLNFLYKNARALIYPSLYEGFGLPTLEAMANNCPVICSITSSIPEIVNNAGQYFDPQSSDDILYSIESVVYSDFKVAQLVKNGKERIKAFSWNNCSKNTEAVYMKLL